MRRGRNVQEVALQDDVVHISCYFKLVILS